MSVSSVTGGGYYLDNVLANMQKEKEKEFNPFEEHSAINSSYIPSEDEDENNVAMSQEDFELIMTTAGFNNEIIDLVKNGMSFTDAISETKEKQFYTLFWKRLAENGENVEEALSYAKSMMTTEITDKDLQEFVQELAEYFEDVDEDIFETLQNISNMLEEKIKAEEEATEFTTEEMMENTNTENEGKRKYTEAMKVDETLKDLLLKSFGSQTTYNTTYNTDTNSSKSFMV